MDYCKHWSGQIRVDTWLDLRGTVGDPQDSTPTTKTDIGIYKCEWGIDPQY